jgi:hypothetical protein
MIVVRLKGGMGNQMFQYAFGLRLSREMGCPLQVDLSFLESKEHDALHVRRQYCLDALGVKVDVYAGNIHQDLEWLVERKFQYDPTMLVHRNNLLVDGYFQTPRYFEPIADEIHRSFSARNYARLDSSLSARFRAPGSVCLNVRRGDFVNNERSRNFHGVLGMDYIHAGVAAIAAKVPNPQFFVFSDEVEWCREHVKLDYPVEVIGHEYAGDRFVDYLHYMAMFQHYIIPNSSFAWWAVWLSSHPQQQRNVVCPARWFMDETYCFDDLIPADWIRI